MSELNKKRIELLKLVHSGEINRENLKEKDYSNSLVRSFKEEEQIIVGGLDSLQLTSKGYLLLSQHNLNEMIRKFSKESRKYSEEMIKETQKLNTFTKLLLAAAILTLIASIINVVVTIV